MSASDWAEVHELQALLRNTQQRSTVYSLAERNWVEVLSKLIDLNLIELMHTLDGSEYLTPQQLEREIKSELSARRGALPLRLDITCWRVIMTSLVNINAYFNDLDIVEGKHNIFWCNV